MEWVSNAKFGQPAESGTVFSVKHLHSIKIHKYKGCGDKWFLSCPILNMDTWELDTEDFDEAVKTAKKIIKERIEKINEAYIPFTNDESENIFVRY